MPISLSCSNKACKNYRLTNSVQDEFAGKKVRCKACGKTMIVPQLTVAEEMREQPIEGLLPEQAGQRVVNMSSSQNEQQIESLARTHGNVRWAERANT